MKNKLTSLIGSVKCLTGHHAFEVTQQFSSLTRRIACRRCHCVFAMHDDLRALVPWDRDFHRLHQSQGVDIIYKDWEFKQGKGRNHEN